MKSLKSEKKELERQRRMMIKNLYKLLDVLEEKPVRRRRTGIFLYDLLEAPINWALLKLEQAVDAQVSASLSRLDGRRRR